MIGHPLLDFVVPLLFGASCGVAFQQFRTHLRDRRIRRITNRLIEW
jgi:hypothetical protein